MENAHLLCVNESIAINKKNKNQILSVGVSVFLENNTCITAKANKADKSSWLKSLKTKLIGIKHVNCLCLTINTFSKNYGFDLSNLLESISIDNIYIGLPDSELSM